MLRNINSTHNYLYCEFVTGTVMYFDLTVDPHQLRNVLHTLSDEEMNHMHEQVKLNEFTHLLLCAIASCLFDPKILYQINIL